MDGEAWKSTACWAIFELSLALRTTSSERPSTGFAAAAFLISFGRCAFVAAIGAPPNGTLPTRELFALDS